MRRTLLALGLVVGALLLITSPAAGALRAAPAPNSLGIRLLDAPRSAAADPRARAYIVDHLAPGTVIHRRVEVSNTTAAVAAVALYPDAAEIRDSVFTPAAAHTVSELTGWTSTDTTALSLAPGARSVSTVTIAVPADASPGERYAVLWAEQTTPAPAGGGVTLVNRVGIRIYLSVGPGGPPPSAFAVDALTARRTPDGRPAVLTQVHNTGGRALDLGGELTLSGGPGGLTAGPFPTELGTTVAPGGSSTVSVLLDPQVPAGPWQAELVLRSGLVEHATRATLRFPDTSAVETPAPAPDGLPAWVGPAVAAIVVAVLAGLLLLGARRRRARQHRTPI